MRVPEVIKLKNGLKVCIIPRSNVDSVTIHLKGLAGSNYENQNQIGAAHMLEHLNLLKGNRNKILLNGGKILGVTSRDDVLYMTKVLKEDVLDALEFLSHIFDKNNFSSEDLEIQKKIIVQEIKRSQNIPEKLISSLSYKILFPGDRLSTKNTGYENHVSSLTESKLQLFYEKFYVPSNFILVLCGNIREKNILPYIKRSFEDLPKGKGAVPIKHTLNKKGVTQTIKSAGLKQSYVKIDIYGYKTDDTKKYYSAVLASILDSYLKNLIREKLGLVYGISCNSFSTGSYGLFSLFFSCEKEKSQLVIKTVLSVTENLTKILSKRNIEQVKRKVIADFKFRFEKTSQIAEYYSDILLHGIESQSHLYELNITKNATLKDIGYIASEVSSQKPKITILTDHYFV